MSAPAVLWAPPWRTAATLNPTLDLEMVYQNAAARPYTSPVSEIDLRGRKPDGPARSESTRATHVLREQIIGGIRPPRAKLVERELAVELGISRVPIREALRALVAEGLVIPRLNSWMTVREFTSRDIEELFEVRSALDPLAFRLAAMRADEEGLARLRSSLDAEGRSSNSSTFQGADFHSIVVQIADNALLSEIWRNIESRMRWLLGQNSDGEELHADHTDLYAAIFAGNAAAAAQLASDHIETSRTFVSRHRT